MKNFTMYQLILSACLVSCFSTDAVGMDQWDDDNQRVNKRRKVENRSVPTDEAITKLYQCAVDNEPVNPSLANYQYQMLANKGVFDSSPETEELKDSKKYIRSVPNVSANIKEKFKNEIENLYDRLNDNNHDFNKSDALIYMICPEEEDKNPEIGHAVLSIIGGTPEAPSFWAAEFDGTYGSFENFTANIFYATQGKIQTLSYADQTNSDQINTNNSVFFFENKFCRSFSKWRLKFWPITEGGAKSIREKVEYDIKYTPLYSLIGLQLNPFVKNSNTYNSSMWAQKIIKDEIDEEIQHMSIAGKELPEDSFPVWLVGSQLKQFDNVAPLLLKDTAKLFLDLLPILTTLLKNLHECSSEESEEKSNYECIEPIVKTTKTMGTRLCWVVDQIPHASSVINQEISKNDNHQQNGECRKRINNIIEHTTSASFGVLGSLLPW